MTSLLDMLKKPVVIAVLAAVVAFAIGVPVGWMTVTVKDTTPAVMRADLQEDYMRMTIDSFRVNRDPNLALQRWDALGPVAPQLFADVRKNPNGMDPAVINIFGQMVTTVKGGDALNPSAQAQTQSGGSGNSLVLFGAIGVILLVVAVVGFIFLRRLLGNRSSGEVTPTMQMVEINKEAAKNKTNFEAMGVAPPITQNMTTYILGDDLYDESFSIDMPNGDFLGEYGVGVSESIGVGEQKKVTALEIWLFDKNDIKTATKVLMSAHAFADPGIRTRLEAKGELVQVEPQKQVMLETETLQLLATVVDLQYGNGSMPDKSYFERITLELAIWPKAK
jgi:hypothetical protein